MHDRRQIFVGRFYFQTKLANFIVRLTPALALRAIACKNSTIHMYGRSSYSGQQTDRDVLDVCEHEARHATCVSHHFNYLTDTLHTTPAHRQTHSPTYSKNTSTQPTDINSCVQIFMDWKPITELRSVTCHMGSQSVTCHLTQVNAPRLNPSHAGRYLIYVPRRDGRLS